MEYFFITRIGDEVVGYVRAVEDGPKTLRVTMARLAMEWCHTSAPTRLFENVYDFCNRHGFSAVMLDPGAAPTMAVRLMEQCGFHPTGGQGRTGRPALCYHVPSSETVALDLPQGKLEPIVA
jgi:hypothetical protein